MALLKVMLEGESLLLIRSFLLYALIGMKGINPWYMGITWLDSDRGIQNMTTSPPASDGICSESF